MESSTEDIKSGYLAGRISELVKQYETAIADILVRHELETSQLREEIRMLREKNNSLNEEISQNYVPENGL